MSKKRQVFRLKIEKVKFDDIKKGDVFILVGDDHEDGSKINLAGGDAHDNGVKCEEISVKELSFMHRELPSEEAYRNGENKQPLLDALLHVPEGIFGVKLPFPLRNSWSIIEAGASTIMTNDEDEFIIELTPAPEWELIVKSPDGETIMSFNADDAIEGLKQLKEGT